MQAHYRQLIRSNILGYWSMLNFIGYRWIMDDYGNAVPMNREKVLFVLTNN